MRSAASSIPTESRTSPQPMPSAARRSAGIEPWLIVSGCPARLSTPPRLSASVNSRKPSRKAPHAAFVRVQIDGDDAAEALHLPLGERVLGMAFKARIDHALDLPVALQMPRHGERVRAVPLHAQRQRFKAAQERERTDKDRAPRRRSSAKSRCAPPAPDRAPRRRPPTISEWPFRYLVAECSTISKPSSSGRWIMGEAKVESATVRMPRALPISAMAARSATLSERIGRRLDPDHAGLGSDGRLERARSDGSA